MNNITTVTGIILTPLKQFDGESGSVYHIMRNTDQGFIGFSEAYISTVKKGAIKGWRRHTKMTLNLVVPIGRVEFRATEVLKPDSPIGVVELSSHHYFRLTVRPGVWLSFRGADVGTNMVINIADLGHDPDEAELHPAMSLDSPLNWA